MNFLKRKIGCFVEFICPQIFFESKAHMKKTALFLLIFFLTVSAYIPTKIGPHLLKHGQSARHQMQHRSFICAWMCTASSFVSTKAVCLGEALLPALETPTLNAQADQKISISSPFIRGPPLFFALSTNN